jgi:CzcA family heavy metal efflux pump
MIDALIRTSLRHRALVVFSAAAVLVWGGWVTPRMPLDVLPDLDAPTVTIVTEAPGLDPVELESLVTLPLETALSGATGVRRVRSATITGVSVITVEFQWGEDIARARQTVTERLVQASERLPAGVRRPLLAPISSIMGEVLFFGLSSDRHAPLELRTVADTLVRRRLLEVPGVSQVIATGGALKQYEVALDPTRLRAHGVALADVERALAEANQNASAGFQAAEGHEYLIRAIGRLTGPHDIGAVAVKTAGTQPVLVRDLGLVRVGEAPRRAEGSLNAAPAVILGVQKQPGVNTLDLTRRIDSVLDEIEMDLPAGMGLDRTLFRQADFIERALGNLLRVLWEGAALVALVIVVFLFDFRAAGITLLALPLSLVVAVLTMSAFGLTINAMTLGGLAIAIGELVDDAIIDVENVGRRLRENAVRPAPERRPVLEVVYQASREIRSAVVFATVVVVLVFLPLFALGSVEGRLLQPLGFAYIVALVASLVVALTVTPVFCSLLLPRARSIRSGREPWLTPRLKRLYEPLLRATLRRPIPVVATALGLLVAAVLALGATGRSFLPPFNEGSLTITAVTLPGTSLADSNALGRSLERLLLSVPEVVSTARRTGRGELDEHVQGVEGSELEVGLRMAGRSKEAMLEEIRGKVALLPGTNVTVGQPISHRIDHMLSGTRASLAVKVFGDDLVILRRLAEAVRAEMQGVDGVVDLSIEAQAHVPMLRVVVDGAAAARHGGSTGGVAATVQTAITGREVSRLLEHQVAVPLVVRYQVEHVGELEGLGATLIPMPSGATVPIAALARIERDRSPNVIRREGMQRRLIVQSNIAGRDPGGVVDDVQARLAERVPLPPGYRIEYGGQFEAEARASRQLLWLSLGVIGAMLLVLATAFGSVRDALIVMLNVPLALIGGVAGVFVAGGVLSVASLIGFITLFGLATRNGILLLLHVRYLQEHEGVVDLRTAILRGASERLVPILMTAITAGLALVPIALAAGQPGAEIQAPMATVIIFGLVTSTALNLLIVPLVYDRFGRPVRPLATSARL